MSNPYLIPFPWRNVMLVIAGGVLLWLLPWLAWTSLGHKRPVSMQRPPPAFRYLRGEKTLDGSAWSPVLMPLPTPEGFSKKAAVNTLRDKGPRSAVAARSATPVYLALTPSTAPELASPGASLVLPQGFEPSAGQTFERTAKASVDDAFQLQVTGGLVDRHFTCSPLHKLPPSLCEGNSVAMTAYVELDRRGVVTHLLLEQPSGMAAVDSAVTRTLWMGRGSPSSGLASGRVRVYYWKADRTEKE